MKRDESVYLRHILDAIIKVDEYLLGSTEDSFYANSLLQDAVIRQLEIIGEATKRLSRDLRSLHPQIPWDDISGMRDKLIHDYFGVDIEKVWLTAAEDLPPFKMEVQKILTTLQAEPPG